MFEGTPTPPIFSLNTTFKGGKSIRKRNMVSFGNLGRTLLYLTVRYSKNVRFSTFLHTGTFREDPVKYFQLDLVVLTGYWRYVADQCRSLLHPVLHSPGQQPGETVASQGMCPLSRASDIACSVAGSGFDAFLTPGSGIRIGMNIPDHIYRGLETFFFVKNT
jgi:hypothetical protein